MTLWLFILLPITVFTLSVVGTASYLHYASRKGILDIPNHRSSHQTPKPRGGGIVIALLSLAMWALAVCSSILSLKQGAALIVSGAMTAVVSYLDDHGHVSRRIRLGVQILAASIGLALLYPLPSLPITELYTLNFNSWLFMPLALVSLIWLTNLYNFMDGIDGIAAAEAIAVTMAAALTLYLNQASNEALLLSLFACIIFGFLIWNWSPAKLFMGDIGSTFIGITLGLLALITAKELSLWFWIIILGCFICDASWTLLTRLLTGQNWRDGHRLHAYQKLSQKHQNHRATTLLYSATTLLWLFPLAYWSTSLVAGQIFLVLLAYIPLMIICYAMSAGIYRPTQTAAKVNQFK